MDTVISKIFRSSGRRYAELKLLAFPYPGSPNNQFVGISGSLPVEGSSVRDDGVAIDVAASVWQYGVFSQDFPEITTLEHGDVIGIAVDLDSLERPVWFSLNGVWLQGDPEAGTDAIGNLTASSAFWISSSIVPSESDFSVRLRTQAEQFEHDIPAGFGAWSDVVVPPGPGSYILRDTFTGAEQYVYLHDAEIRPVDFFWDAPDGIADTGLKMTGGVGAFNDGVGNYNPSAEGWTANLTTSFQMLLRASMGADVDSGRAAFYIVNTASTQELLLELNAIGGGLFLPTLWINGVSYGGIGIEEHDNVEVRVVVTPTGFTLFANDVELAADTVDLSSMAEISYMECIVDADAPEDVTLHEVSLQTT